MRSRAHSRRTAYVHTFTTSSHICSGAGAYKPPRPSAAPSRTPAARACSRRRVSHACMHPSHPALASRGRVVSSPFPFPSPCIHPCVHAHSMHNPCKVRGIQKPSGMHAERRRRMQSRPHRVIDWCPVREARTMTACYYTPVATAAHIATATYADTLQSASRGGCHCYSRLPAFGLQPPAWMHAALPIDEASTSRLA